MLVCWLVHSLCPDWSILKFHSIWFRHPLCSEMDNDFDDSLIFHLVPPSDLNFNVCNMTRYRTFYSAVVIRFSLVHANVSNYDDGHAKHYTCLALAYLCHCEHVSRLTLGLNSHHYVPDSLSTPHSCSLCSFKDALKKPIRQNSVVPCAVGLCSNGHSYVIIEKSGATPTLCT